MNQKTAKKLRKFANQRMESDKAKEVFYKRSKKTYKKSEHEKKVIINQMLNEV